MSTLETLSAVQISHYLSSYSDAIASKPSSTRGESLVELDAWYQALPRLSCVSDLSRGLAGKDELVKLMLWKLSREKHRPNLLSLIRSNTPAVCEHVLRRAADNLLSHTPTPSSLEECLSAVEGTMRILAELRGIGPATSSAIVATWCDAGVFQSDELATAVLGQGTKLEYTWGFYKRFYRSVWEVQKAMKGVESGRTLERVAWSMAYAPAAAEEGEKGEDAGGAKGKGKGKGKEGAAKDEEGATVKGEQGASKTRAKSGGGDGESKRKGKESKPTTEVKEEGEGKASRRTSKRLRSR